MHDWQGRASSLAWVLWCATPRVSQVCGSVKRDLFIWQKRPIHIAKETYSYGKRGLLLLAYLRYANVNRPLLPYE